MLLYKTPSNRQAFSAVIKSPIAMPTSPSECLVQVQLLHSNTDSCWCPSLEIINDCSSTWFPFTHMGNSEWVLDILASTQPSYFRHLGSYLGNGRFLSISPSTIIYQSALQIKWKQINKSKAKSFSIASWQILIL